MNGVSLRSCIAIVGVSALFIRVLPKIQGCGRLRASPTGAAEIIGLYRPAKRTPAVPLAPNVQNCVTKKWLVKGLLINPQKSFHNPLLDIPEPKWLDTPIYFH